MWNMQLFYAWSYVAFPGPIHTEEIIRGLLQGAVVSLYSHIVYMNVYEWEYYVSGTSSYNNLMLPNLKKRMKRLSSTEMSAYKKQSCQSIVRPLV